MKLKDVLYAITKTLSSTGISVFVEDVANKKDAFISLNVIESSRESISNQIEELEISFDVSYFPVNINKSNNIEIYDVFDKISEAFQISTNGQVATTYRGFFVPEGAEKRYIPIKRMNTRIVDNKGILMFDTTLRVEVANSSIYKVMKEFKLELNKEEE